MAESDTAGEEQDAPNGTRPDSKNTPRQRLENKPNDQGVVGRNAEEIYDQGTYQKEENTQRTTTYYTNQRSIYTGIVFI